jgi:hypothetical protein
VLDLPFNGNGDGLVHLVAADDACLRFADLSFSHFLAFTFVGPVSAALQL